MQRLLACLVLLVVTSCAGQTATVTSPASPVPYQTNTPSATASAITSPAGVTLPTPTTYVYTVIQGDTLIRIAARLNITLEALLAANPGIQPSALQVGMQLKIPVENLITTRPAPTPAPLPFEQPACWPEPDGGLWCFVLVQNDQNETIENISVLFTLLDSNGREVGSQVGFGLLDTLAPGKFMPLVAHFTPPVKGFASLQVQLLTAIRQLPGDERYLPVMLENTLAVIGASGRTAQLTGQVILVGSRTAGTLWVLAIAYDASGDVVGVRRWESSTVLAADAPLPFEFLLSSLGPEIARVEFLAEARP